MKTRPRPRRPARWAGLGLLLLATAGCSYPTFGFPNSITVQGNRVMGLWQGSFWAAMGVGALVIGLILFACFRFRKRGERLPQQVHYNLPIEMLYTLIPFVIIGVLFYFTAVDENYQNKLSAHPDVVVGVVGFQWAWQFDYPQVGLQVTGRPGQYPTLVLPVGKTVQFLETSPDVIHSFWVPQFLFKRDVIPGRVNRFEVTLDHTGVYRGRCTELCGLYHWQMLFTLRAVSWPAYQAYLRSALAQARTGTSDMYTTTSASGSAT